MGRTHRQSLAYVERWEGRGEEGWWQVGEDYARVHSSTKRGTIGIYI